MAKRKFFGGSGSRVERSNKRHREIIKKLEPRDDFMSSVKELYHHYVVRDQQEKGRILTQDEKKRLFTDARGYIRYQEDKYNGRL